MTLATQLLGTTEECVEYSNMDAIAALGLCKSFASRTQSSLCSCPACDGVTAAVKVVRWSSLEWVELKACKIYCACRQTFADISAGVFSYTHMTK